MRRVRELHCEKLEFCRSTPSDHGCCREVSSGHRIENAREKVQENPIAVKGPKANASVNINFIRASQISER